MTAVRRRALPAARAGIAALAMALICGGLQVAHADQPAKTVTLYSGQHQQMVRLLVQAFEKATGIHVEVRDGEGPELANAIQREGAQTPADVFITENSPGLMRLQENGLLAALPKKILAQIPSRYSSDKGLWVGVLARENVLTYNPTMVKQAQLPKSVLGLAEPQWKGRIGVHLTSPDVMPLIRAVELKYGHDRALKWLEGIKRNAKLYQSSSGVVLAVDKGDLAVGISNSYYYYRLRQQVGAKNMVSRVYHFSGGDPGGIINISGAAVLKHAPHPEAARRLVAFMVGKKAQKLLAGSDVDYEYPLRTDVAANPVLKPLAELEPPQLSVSQLGDDSQALELLQQAGLL